MSDNYLWFSLPNLGKVLLIVDGICLSGVDKGNCLSKWNEVKQLKGQLSYTIQQVHLQDMVDVWQDLERLQVEYLITKE